MTSTKPANFVEIELALQDAYKQAENDPQKAFKTGIELSDQFQELEHQKNSIQYAQTQFLLATCLYQFGDLDCAYQKIQLAIQLFDKFKNDPLRIKALILSSKILNQKNEYSAAMENILKALTACHRLNDPTLIGEVLLNKAILYLSIKNTQQALIELNKCFQIYYLENNTEKQNIIHCLFAWAYFLQNDVQNSLIHKNKCKQDKANNIFDCAFGLNLIGTIDAQSSELINAKKCFTDSLLISEQHGFLLIKIYALIRLGLLAKQENEIDKAELLFLQAYQQSLGLSYNNGLLTTHQHLAELYDTKQDFQKAHFHLKHYLQIKNIVDQEVNKLTLSTIENNYQNRSLQNEARIIEQKNQQLEQEIKERKWIEQALRDSEENYRKLASLDPLTNLFNRRYFFELAHNEINRSKRYKNPLSLLMIDIDHFKQINDRLGHQIGDEVLQWMTSQLRECLRDVDIIARYGGEEFIILLPETDSNSAKLAANRLVHFFDQTLFNSNNPPIQVTISIGLSVYTETESLDNFINRADQALFRAKHNGRNCISE